MHFRLHTHFSSWNLNSKCVVFLKIYTCFIVAWIAFNRWCEHAVAYSMWKNKSKRMRKRHFYRSVWTDLSKNARKNIHLYFHSFVWLSANSNYTKKMDDFQRNDCDNSLFFHKYMVDRCNNFNSATIVPVFKLNHIRPIRRIILSFKCHLNVFFFSFSLLIFHTSYFSHIWPNFE